MRPKLRQGLYGRQLLLPDGATPRRRDQPPRWRQVRSRLATRTDGYVVKRPISHTHYSPADRHVEESRRGRGRLDRFGDSRISNGWQRGAASMSAAVILAKRKAASDRCFNIWFGE